MQPQLAAIFARIDSIMSSRRNAKKASKKERRLSKAIRRGATDDMLAAGVGSLNVTNAEEDAEAMKRFLDKIPPEKQREIVARQKEDDAYEKVATQDLMRAFDLARAYKYEGPVHGRDERGQVGSARPVGSAVRTSSRVGRFPNWVRNHC